MYKHYVIFMTEDQPHGKGQLSLETTSLVIFIDHEIAP
jgi:hypothetical protein